MLLGLAPAGRRPWRRKEGAWVDCCAVFLCSFFLYYLARPVPHRLSRTTNWSRLESVSSTALANAFNRNLRNLRRELPKW